VKSQPTTIGALRESGWQSLTVKEELRKNLLQALADGRDVFPGIIGYEKTVLPALQNAILSQHDFILLGLRGQAKTRILRQLKNLLDPAAPIIKGSEIHDHPYAPISHQGVEMVRQQGDDTEIEWIGPDERYHEKLATPDVTIADLIGDIDPIKAATQRLHYAHEGVIHYGLIPRTNRGIFAINELPDLPPRIQVGLLNIMQERDIQIRGFPIRIPLDMLMIYSANPEDYTNRGNIITPLRDRIGSQIHTHYPVTVDDAIAITEQEARISRNGTRTLTIPRYYRELVEHIAFQARKSEFVDQQSGVSARLTIACLENLVSNAERRAVLHGEAEIFPRICDLDSLVPAIAGKIELVYEGEQEGPQTVARALIGRAVKAVFGTYFPEAIRDSRQPDAANPYQEIKRWFALDEVVEIADDVSTEDYYKALSKVPGLQNVARQYLKLDGNAPPAAVASAMEFVLEGLHQHSVLSKQGLDAAVSYRDMVDTIFDVLERED
jgi:magnesium chelatase subunit I